MIHVNKSNKAGQGGNTVNDQTRASGGGTNDTSAKTAMAAAMPSSLVRQSAAPTPTPSPAPAPAAPAPTPPAPPPPVQQPVAPVKAISTTNVRTQNIMQQSALARITRNSSFPLAANPAAEAMKNFIESAKTVIENAGDSDYLMTVVPINALEQSSKLFASGLVLVVQRKSSPDAALAYHTCLLADTSERPPTQTIQIEGQNVEILRAVGDAYDDDYRAVVASALVRSFPRVAKDNMYDADAEVIPTGYNSKDIALMQKTLFNALAAAGTILDTNAADYKDTSIVELLADGERIDSVSKLQFGQPTAANSVGAPVRQDVSITYSLVTGQQQGKSNQVQSLNSGQMNHEVFQIGGFMELLWRPVDSVIAGGGNAYASAFQQPQQQVANQMPHMYQPRFVITNTPTGALSTLPGQLWGLASLLVLRMHNNWMGAFSRAAGSDDYLHDIGAIGIEAAPNGVGTRFDTRSINFTDKDLAALLHAFVRPELVFSIDVEECGPTSWLNNVFLASAFGIQSATEQILDAASYLTGGHFARLWPANGQVMVNDENRIHLGNFTDQRGQVRDLRDIDHLAVLNQLGEKNPELGAAFSDTYTQTGWSVERRMQERLRIMQVISPNVKVTGYAYRVTFTNLFLDTLAAAIAAAGLSVRADTPFVDTGASKRGQADFLAAATQGLAGNQSLFTRGYGASNPGSSFRASSAVGRWR